MSLRCLYPPPPPGISYALVQATVGVGTVLIWDFGVAYTRGGGGVQAAYHYGQKTAHSSNWARGGGGWKTGSKSQTVLFPIETSCQTHSAQPRSIMTIAYFALLLCRAHRACTERCLEVTAVKRLSNVSWAARVSPSPKRLWRNHPVPWGRFRTARAQRQLLR